MDAGGLSHALPAPYYRLSEGGFPSAPTIVFGTCDNDLLLIFPSPVYHPSVLSPVDKAGRNAQSIVAPNGIFCYSAHGRRVPMPVGRVTNMRLVVQFTPPRQNEPRRSGVMENLPAACLCGARRQGRQERSLICEDISGSFDRNESSFKSIVFCVRL